MKYTCASKTLQACIDELGSRFVEQHLLIERQFLYAGWLDPVRADEVVREAGLAISHFCDISNGTVFDYIIQAVADGEVSMMCVESCWSWMTKSNVAWPDRVNDFLDAVLSARADYDGNLSDTLPSLAERIIANSEARRRAHRHLNAARDIMREAIPVDEPVRPLNVFRAVKHRRATRRRGHRKPTYA